MANRLFYTTILMIVLITVASAPAYASAGNYNGLLRAMGIDGPYGHMSSFKDVIDVSIDYREIDLGNYTLVEIKCSGMGVSRNSIPGHPYIPFLVKELVINGVVDKRSVRVLVTVYDFDEITLPKPIIPAPQPLAYGGGYTGKLEYKEDPVVYSLDTMYPGKILNYDVWHGFGGKTIIVLRLYPIQYNPSTGKVVIVKKARIYVTYAEPYKIEYDSRGVLILTSMRLFRTKAISSLMELYSKLGYKPYVMAVEDIYRKYTEAENITAYPGFYTIKPTKDPIYEILVRTYNWRMALRIISFLRSTMGKFSYIVIVGSARDVPPSFYYYLSYPFWYTYDLWIPTDFFYASPDYDLAPDMYVGRIPFSDPNMIESYVKKLYSWYEAGGNKLNKLYISAGYPFELPLMYGETFISTMAFRKYFIGFNTTLMLRTSENYNSTYVKNVMAGNVSALWYFALAHGNGFALLDPLIKFVEGRFYYMTETLVTVDDLLSFKPKALVPIVSSVACRNAIWDEALIPYPSPTFGEAVLLSPAGGVAYIGSSRIAFEIGVMITVDKGILVADSYGAAKLHATILREYTRLMGDRINVTLGEIVWRGATDYLAEATAFIETEVEEEKARELYKYIALSEVMKLALLGDPAITIVYPEKAPKVRYLEKAYVPEPKTYLDASIIFYYTNGSVPVYEPMTSQSFTVYGADGDYYARLVRIYSSKSWLNGYITLNVSTVCVRRGAGIYSIFFDKNSTGKLLAKIGCDGWGELRLFISSAGIILEPKSTIPGGPISVEGYGLDLFGFYMSVDLIVAGRIIATLYPDITGYITWSLALPYLAPGSYDVWFSIRMYGMTPEVIEEIKKVFLEKIDVYVEKPITIHVSIPEMMEPADYATGYVQVLIDGRPVKASLNVTVVTPAGAVEALVKPIGIGFYEVKFPAKAPGPYTIYITASYMGDHIRAYGATTYSFTVSEKIYTGIREVGESVSGYTDVVKRSVEVLKDEVTSYIKLLNKTYSSAIASLKNDITLVREEVRGLRPLIGEIGAGQGRVLGELMKVYGEVSSVRASVEAVKAYLIIVLLATIVLLIMLSLPMFIRRG